MSVSDWTVIDQACRRTLDRVAVLVRLSVPGSGVIFVNQAWCNLTGTTLEENLGDGWLAVVHEADRARVLVALATSPQMERSEYRLQTRDGRTIAVTESSTAWTDDQEGREDGVVHTITSRDTAEPGGQAMSKWAHELRGPLNAILGWSDLLGSGNNDPAVVQRGLKAIANNARQQAAIIKRMAE